MAWWPWMRVSDLRGNMDAELTLAGLWDWCFLNDCFGSEKQRVGDVDGIFERNGHILVIEGKPLWFVPHDKHGQVILWRALARRGIWVLVLWGEAENEARPNHKTPTRAMLWRPGDQRMPRLRPTSVAVLRRWVSRWYKRADKSPYRVRPV